MLPRRPLRTPARALRALVVSLLPVALLALPAVASAATSTTFSYTGSVQTYTVPAGDNALDVTAIGGEGGPGGNGAYPGGFGGEVSSTISVTPGETLYVYVGGNGSQGANAPGGFNGGGDAQSANAGGSGGGASDIRAVEGDLGSRLIVAGGGGGAGSNWDMSSTAGGSAGYPSGASGSGSDSYGHPGTGGGQYAGGVGGWSTIGGSGNGHDGSFGLGGEGGGYFYPPYTDAGAGGGGYYGGAGGGSFSGGGGGSDYVAPGGNHTVYSTDSTGVPSVTVTPESSSISVGPTSQVWGPVATGSDSSPATFTVTNGGTGDTTISAASISGPNSSSFTISNNTCTAGTVLRPGGTCTLHVIYTGTSTAAYGELDVTSSTGDYGASLVGNPPASPATISVSPSPVSFGDAQEGQTAAQNVTVTNNGNVALTPGASSVSNDAHSEFSVASDGCKGASLSNGQSCTITVHFAPNTADTQETGRLNIPNNGGSTAAALQGTGQTPPAIGVSHGPVNFGNVQEGQTASQTVTVTNNGETPLQPGASTVSNDAHSEFSVASDGCKGASLATGQSCTIKVTFAPATRDSQESAQLNIPNNDPSQNGSTAVNLDGSGKAAPTVSVPAGQTPTLTIPHLPAGGLRIQQGAHNGQTTLTVQLSAPGTVTLTVQRQVGGRWVAVGTQTVSASHAGAMRLTLGAEVGGHRLTPGHYRVVLQASSAGKRSAPVTAGLTITPANGPHGQPRLLSVTLNPHTIVWRKDRRAPRVWLTFLLSRPATLHMTLQARIHGHWRQVAAATTRAGAGADRVQLLGRWKGRLVPARVLRLTVQGRAAGMSTLTKTFWLTVRHGNPWWTGTKTS